MPHKRTIDKIEILKRIANSTDGMTLIKYLKEDFCLKSPVDKESTHFTYFNLGVQSVVNKALSMIEDTEKYERITLIQRDIERKNK